MTKEALKLALKALTNAYWPTDSDLMPAHNIKECADAITAIKEALAQPEPKCVAIVEVFGKDWRLDFMSLPVGKHKLYAQQYIYTTPPQRKPLSDDEIEKLAEQVGMCIDKYGLARDAENGLEDGVDVFGFARAIEAKIKENT